MAHTTERKVSSPKLTLLERFFSESDFAGSRLDETLFQCENWANITVAVAWSRAYNRFNAPFMFLCVRCLRRSLRALYEREFVAGNADEQSEGTKQQAA